jgi:hypothetical protein
MGIPSLVLSFASKAPAMRFFAAIGFCSESINVHHKKKKKNLASTQYYSSGQFDPILAKRGTSFESPTLLGGDNINF